MGDAIVISGLPARCTPSDVSAALAPFGGAASAAFHGDGAVIRLSSPSAAQTVVSRRSLVVLGKSCPVDFLSRAPRTDPSTPMSVRVGGSPQHHPMSRLRVHVDMCTYPITQDVLQQVFLHVARPRRVTCAPTGPSTVEGIVEFVTPEEGRAAVLQLSGRHIYPGCCLLTLTPEPIRVPIETAVRVGRGPAPGGFQPYPTLQSGEFTVVTVANVPTTSALQPLWILLEVYGNVRSLRRQYVKPTTVIARYENPQDARTCVRLLQGCPYMGESLLIKPFSTYVERPMEWPSTSPSDPSTLAFDFSLWAHRYKPHLQHAPRKHRFGEYLFVSNLSGAIGEEKLREAWGARGLAIAAIQRRTDAFAVVVMESAAKAVEALVSLHGSHVADRTLRISFTQRPQTRSAEEEESHEEDIETETQGDV